MKTYIEGYISEHAVKGGNYTPIRTCYYAYWCFSVDLAFHHNYVEGMWK